MLNLCIQENGGLTDSEATHRITAVLEAVTDLQISSPHIGSVAARDYADAVVAHALRPGNDSTDVVPSRHDVSDLHEVNAVWNQQKEVGNDTEVDDDPS